VRNAQLLSAPLVGLLTIAITTLLLVAATKALWLVVPLLIAIILYYMLYPIVHRVALTGIGREASAALITGAVVIVGVAVMVPLLSWLAGQAVSGEETMLRYLEGGRRLVDRTLAGLESQFAFLKRMNFHADMGRRLNEMGDTFVQKQLGALLLGAAGSLPTLLLAPFFAFFFLRDGQLFKQHVLREVPNAFFERTIAMFERVDATARSYFQGLLKLTAIDTLFLGVGLWIIGVPGAFMLGLVAAVFEWIPLVGTFAGAGLAVLVAATALPNDPWIVYLTAGVFVVNRMLDNFFFIPLTVGRSIQMHPLPTVLMVFIGGAVAGIAGLILALPLAGVVSAIVGTIGGILQDPRLRARNKHAKALLAKRVNVDFETGA
jgi:predicted PurR-regulated permease PerM